MGGMAALHAMTAATDRIDPIAGIETTTATTTVEIDLIRATGTRVVR